MPVEIKVTGGERFLRLSKALKSAGLLGLRKELNKNIRVAAQPLIPEVREAAREQLPHSGGLNEVVAKAPTRVQALTGINPGVKIKTGGRRGSGVATNRGQFQHPVFGHRDRWVPQDVEPGWFDKTLAASAPEFVPAIELAIAAVEAQFREAVF